MAKWGEGDPRWIVEERADATNVNNWHWTEKNATPWSKDKLKELLTSIKVENDKYFCRIKSLNKCDGEASANNRKAKLIFFYEWTIQAEWEGSYKDSDNKTVYKGKIDVPNLSEENNASEVDVEVSIEDSKQDKLKEFMRREGVIEIRKQFELYLKLLKEEFSQGLILPTKDSVKKTTTNGANKSSSETTTSKSTSTSKSETANQTTGSAKLQTKTLKLAQEFKCRAEELYLCFTDINLIRAYTHDSNAICEAKENGRFVLFDGNISGTFTELLSGLRIIMNWRYKQWPADHYSVATLDFLEQEDNTRLTLVQTGVPETFYDNTKDGWTRFYWNSIKQTFGYGSRIM